MQVGIHKILNLKEKKTRKSSKHSFKMVFKFKKKDIKKCGIRFLGKFPHILFLSIFEPFPKSQALRIV